MPHNLIMTAAEPLNKGHIVLGDLYILKLVLYREVVSRRQVFGRVRVLGREDVLCQSVVYRTLHIATLGL